MVISKATLNNVAELTALVNTAYRGKESMKGWATEAHILDGQRIDRDMMTEYFTDAGTTILKYTNEANEIEACVYLQKQDEKLYLGMLSVLPHLQAKGIGRQLLQAAESLAKELNYTAISMTVISSRQQLIEWYERRGYTRTGEVLPFHADTRFGIPKVPIELVVLEKGI
jgi:ribosomal protein S18 acetylase RimI-like enzyme